MVGTAIPPVEDALPKPMVHVECCIQQAESRPSTVGQDLIIFALFP